MPGEPGDHRTPRPRDAPPRARDRSPERSVETDRWREMNPFVRRPKTGTDYGSSAEHSA
jgi:hypothetical protein